MKKAGCLSLLVAALMLGACFAAKHKPVEYDPPLCCTIAEAETFTSATVQTTQQLPFYGMALAVADRVYVQSTNAIDANYYPVTPNGSYIHQTHYTLQLIESQLASLNLNRDDILRVSLSTSARDPRLVLEVEEAYSRFFAGAKVKPARSTQRIAGNLRLGLTVEFEYLVTVDVVALNRNHRIKDNCTYPLWELGDRLTGDIPAAVRVGNDVYTSDISGGNEGSLSAQTTATLEAIEALLEKEAMDRSDIVRVEVLLGRDEDVEELNAAYKEFFKGHRPPVRALKNTVFAGEPGVRVRMNVLAHQAPYRCNQPNVKYNVNDSVWLESGVTSHAVRIGRRIHTAMVAGTVPLSYTDYNYRVPVIKDSSFEDEVLQALTNVEKITSRGGASKLRWVWQAAYLTRYIDEYWNVAASFWNGSSSVPCPKAHYPSFIGISEAQFAAEAVAYGSSDAGMAAVEFNPIAVDFAALAGEVEGLLNLPAGTLAPDTACVDSTNPVCPDSTDFRGDLVQPSS